MGLISGAEDRVERRLVGKLTTEEATMLGPAEPVQALAVLCPPGAASRQITGAVTGGVVGAVIGSAIAGRGDGLPVWLPRSARYLAALTDHRLLLWKAGSTNKPGDLAANLARSAITGATGGERTVGKLQKVADVRLWFSDGSEASFESLVTRSGAAQLVAQLAQPAR